jgi:hypothetical protein
MDVFSTELVPMKAAREMKDTASISSTLSTKKCKANQSQPATAESDQERDIILEKSKETRTRVKASKRLNKQVQPQHEIEPGASNNVPLEILKPV